MKLGSKTLVTNQKPVMLSMLVYTYDNMVGGVVGGGTASNNQIINIVATGGAVTAGAATVNEVEGSETYNEVATGGIVASGAATVNEVDAPEVEPELCKLTLQAGMVASDVGYLYVPVFLNTSVDTTNFDFLTMAGKPIPYYTRKTEDNNVQAMVYLRPSPTIDYNFVLRVN